MSVTDGNLGTSDGATQTVRVVGSISTTPSGTQTVSGTVTANQGTAAALASAWPIKITDGSNAINLAVPGPNLGTGIQVSTGVLIASTTVNAQTGSVTGTAVDFGAARSNISAMVMPLTGVSGGTASLQVSQDGTNWVTIAGPTAALAAGTNVDLTKSGIAYRYARAITTSVTGGNVTITVMGS